jgi:hypothetical protein
MPSLVRLLPLHMGSFINRHCSMFDCKLFADESWIYVHLPMINNQGMQGRASCHNPNANRCCAYHSSMPNRPVGVVPVGELLRVESVYCLVMADKPCYRARLLLMSLHSLTHTDHSYCSVGAKNRAGQAVVTTPKFSVSSKSMVYVNVLYNCHSIWYSARMWINLRLLRFIKQKY